MKLKAKYDSKEGIPEGYTDLFTGSDEDGWTFVGLEGGHTEEDFQRVDKSLRAERKAHTDTKNKLKVFGDRTADEVDAAFEELEELRGLTEDGEDLETKINQAAEARVKRATGPLERQIKKLEGERDAANGERDAIQSKLTTTIIETALNKTINAQGVRSEAVDDVLRYASIFETDDDGTRTREGVGCTPGLSTDEWLKEVKESKPHWWDPSSGGGATGSTDTGGSGKKVEDMSTNEKLAFRG